MLTIICPSYNRGKCLPECVAPLMELPAEVAEVLVVDDCSEDGTREVCSELARRYGGDRVRYFRLDRNEGAPTARNHGVAHARGNYIMFVDSDDVPVAAGIRELVRTLETCRELDYAYGEVVLTDEELRPILGVAPVGNTYDGSSAGLAGYHWHTMGAVYRRSCLEKVGLWAPELTGSQDWEFQARVKAFGGKGCFVPVVVGYWRQHAESRVGTSTFRPDYVQSVMKACASILSHSRKAGKCDRVLEWRLARRLAVHAIGWGGAGHSQEQRACLAQAAETAPSCIALRVIVSVFRWTPQPIDLLADLAIRRIQRRP
jgi:glycosyltransferase involved in cell wall biosynthesis